jgi:twitching motility two-component system response regulator PilG
VSWFFFFCQGQLTYATAYPLAGTSPGPKSQRLLDHLQRYSFQGDLDTLLIPPPTAHVPEYGYLWALLEQGLLTPTQARKIVRSLICETLFDVLGLYQGRFLFLTTLPLSPQLVTLEISVTLPKVLKQIYDWKQFYPLLRSPDQRLKVGDLGSIREQISEEALKIIEAWSDGTHSIRQISRYLNRDIVSVIRVLHPYIQTGTFQILPPVPADRSDSSEDLEDVLDPRPPRIVCVDADAQMRKGIETLLNHQGYEATSLGNAFKALSLLFQLKPDLLLYSMAMVEIGGYEMCAMLRQSSVFRHTPIIMMTEETAWLDRMRGNMAGVTDYLTKPFRSQDCLGIVEKYVGPGRLESPAPVSLLWKDMREGLGSLPS